MTTYSEVTTALVSAEFLSEADVDAAVKVLEDSLLVADAEETKAFAAADIADQAEVIAKAKELVDTDYEMGDIGDRFVQAEVINNATTLADNDKVLIEQADAQITLAYEDAAAALLAAELIDEVNLEAVIGVISNVWMISEED